MDFGPSRRSRWRLLVGALAVVLAVSAAPVAPSVPAGPHAVTNPDAATGMRAAAGSRTATDPGAATDPAGFHSAADPQRAADPQPGTAPHAPTGLRSAAGSHAPGDYPDKPQNDPFYQPPAPIPDVAPGTILRSRPVTVRAFALPVPVRAWQILYRSTDTTGTPNVVSGTVLLPQDGSANSNRPLVSYSVASHGLGPECAPSYNLRRGSEPETGLIAQPLARGWAVAVSDYEGSGTPGPHTYGAGTATGQAVLDAARAALRLPAAGLDRHTPVGIWGYSEGGLASAWAGELAPTYAPELNLVGVAAGGVPVDLGTVAARIDGTEWFGILLAAAVGLDHAYPHMDLPSVLNDPGRVAYDRIQTMCVEEFTRTFAYHRMDDYTTVPNAIARPRFQRVIADTHLGRRTPSAPVYIYQSVNDELVPVRDVRGLVGSYCRDDVAVTYSEDRLSEHVSLAATGAPGAVLWLADRFAGKPPPTSC